MKRSVLAALVCTAVLAGAGGSAHATVQIGCQSGCVSEIGFTTRDYTILPDGNEYEWDITNAVGATITLQGPNEVDPQGIYSDGLGGETGGNFVNGPVPYLFQETTAPGLTKILVRGPANFDNCATTFTAGTLCGVDYIVWGNGTILSFDGLSAPKPPVEYFIRVTPVPEPATWAMMLAGFFGLGMALRSRRYALSLKLPEHRPTRLRK